MAILGILALWVGFTVEPIGNKLSPAQVTSLNNQWDILIQGESGAAEYRYLIPENTDDSLWLYLKTYLQEFQMLLDGDVFYSFSDTYDMGNRSQHIVNLPQNAQGRVLAVWTESTNAASAERNQIGNAYLGEENAVLTKLLGDNLYALIFLIFTILLGAMMLITTLWTRKSSSGGLSGSLLNFSVFVLITGVWVLTDSELLLFVTNKVAAVSLISFVSFMIMPVFLLRFINSILGEKRIFHVICRLFFVITALYLANYLLHVVPGYLLLMPTHLLCIFSAVLVIKIGLERLKRSNDKVIRRIMEGFGLLTIFIAAALIQFYINPVSHYSYIYCIGIFFFILCLMSAELSRLYGQMEENANAAAYRRLAYLDMMTGLGNRTAFIEEQKKEEPCAGVAYILFDINDLKQTNDQYGHQEGDLLISAVAGCIRDVFGESGKCYRIGGDEFVVILEDSSASDTTEKLNRMRARIAEENEKRTIPLDIAAGYAVWQGAETADQLYQRADVNMYEEKQRMKAGKDV